MTTVAVPVLQHYMAAINAHDVEAIVAAHTADATMDMVAAPEESSQGTAGIRHFWQEHFAAIPDFHFDFAAPVRAGDAVTLEWTMAGTYQGDDPGFGMAKGKPFRIRGVSVLELAEGKIYRERQYFDGATMLRQFGLLPAEPPA